MYTFYLDITSFSTPVSGGDYIQVPNDEIVYNGVTVDVKKYKEDFFKRIELNGTTKFLSDTYTALRTLSATTSKVKIKVMKGAILQAEANLNIRKQFDQDSFISLNDSTPLDKYTEFVSKYDKPLDMLVSEEIRSCRVTKTIEFETNTVVQNIFLVQSSSGCSKSLYTALQNLITPPLLTDIKAGTLSSPWRNVKTDIVQTSCVGVTNSDRICEVTTTYQRQIIWVAEVGGDFEDPGSEWTDVSAEAGGSKTIGLRNYHKYAKEPYSGITEYQLSYITSTSSSYFLLDLDSIEDYVVYTRLRELRDVIKVLVQGIDSTIVFDSNSFPYFDEVSDYNELFIMTMTDSLLNDEGDQKGNGAVRSELILKDLLEYFRTFRIYWYIDNSNRFVLDHWKNIETITTTFDATNINGRDWSKGKNKLSYNDGRLYSKHILNLYSGNLDFLQQTVEFPKLTSIAQTLITELYGFNTDILDIQNNPSTYNDSYSDFCILACRDKETVDYIVNNMAGGHRYGGDELTGFAWVDSIKTGSGVATGEGAMHTNNFDGVKGHTINITLFYSAEAAALNNYFRIMRRSDDAIIESFDLTIDSLNEFTYELPDSVEYYFEIFKGFGSGTPTFMTVQNIQIYDQDEYEVIINTGIMSETDATNEPLSLSRLLQDSYTYRLPDRTMEYNETSTLFDADRLLKAKEQDIIIPIVDINDIDVDGVITEYDTGELQSASMPLNGGFTKVNINQE